MLVLGAKDQQQLLNMSEVIEHVETALGEYSAGSTQTPVRTALPVSKQNGTGLFMPSLAESMDAYGIKCVNIFPGNKELGKPSLHGVVMLMDTHTGEPLSLLEGAYLTAARTGALSGVATKYLATEEARTLCVIGTGVQAKGLVQAMLAVRPIEQIRLFNRTTNKAYDFKNDLIKEDLVEGTEVIVCDDVEDAITTADIIVTATNSETPVLSADQIKPGAHINAVGSFRPNMQELPAEVMVRADKIVVESKEAAIEEAGDLVIPIEQGQMQADSIHAELGDIINGKHQGRESNTEWTVFDSVGLAVADIMIAKLFYGQAGEKGLGQQVSL